MTQVDLAFVNDNQITVINEIGHGYCRFVSQEPADVEG